MHIGLQLGADVPFFLQGRNAWVQGIGENIVPIDVPAAGFLVVKPPAGLETARIFQSEALKRDTETAIIAGFAENPFCFGTNDLQAVAQGLCQGVSDGLNWLQAQHLKGRMTGSGSAVFAHLESGAGFELPATPAGFVVRVCKNLQEHPLSGWAG